METTEFKEWISNANIKDLAEQIVLGPQEEVLRKIEDFNNCYGVSLGVTNTFRWKPGTYKHYKEQVNRLQMFTKRCSSLARIHWRMLDTSYRLNRMSKSIQAIENILWTMRSDNITFQDNSDIAEESLEIIKTIIENADSKYGIKFYIVDKDFYGMNKTLFEIVLPLDKGIMHVFTPGEEGEKIAQVPYLYDTYVKASLPFRKFLNTFVSLQNNDKVKLTNNEVTFSGKLKDNKHYVKHPYIRGGYGNEWELYDSNHDMREWSYICLGNMQSDFAHFIATLDVENLNWYLNKWHNNYIVNVTNPLNNIKQMYHGSPKFLDNKYHDIVGKRSTNNCKYPQIFSNTIQDDIPYCDAFECTTRDKCGFYQENFYNVPEGEDAQWLYLLSEIYGDNYPAVVRQLARRNIDYEILYHNLADPIEEIKQLVNAIYDATEGGESSITMLYEILGVKRSTRIMKGSTEFVMTEEKLRLNEIYNRIWDDGEGTLEDRGISWGDFKYNVPFRDVEIEKVENLPTEEMYLGEISGPVPTEWAEYFANNNRRPI